MLLPILVCINLSKVSSTLVDLVVFLFVELIEMVLELLDFLLLEELERLLELPETLERQLILSFPLGIGDCVSLFLIVELLLPRVLAPIKLFSI